ncbi:hypothetical protein [Acidithrix sp. C25]|uniref:hypothetical protein n=1 Tax=Acidithrix sp. C25 TaxID=1671482 RepID=UPI00191BC734|nr:hypothetical protein [Acidithrix sp. C25]
MDVDVLWVDVRLLHSVSEVPLGIEETPHPHRSQLHQETIFGISVTAERLVYLRTLMCGQRERSESYGPLFSLGYGFSLNTIQLSTSTQIHRSW